MADIPATGKSINDFSTGTVSAGALFPAAFPDPNTGHNTGKISASELGQGMGENIQFAGLNTINKTIFGAINEIKTLDPTITDFDVVNIPAGQTELIKFNSFYDPGATFDIFTDYFAVNINMISIVNNPMLGTGVAVGLNQSYLWDINLLFVKRG